MTSRNALRELGGGLFERAEQQNAGIQPPTRCRLDASYELETEEGVPPEVEEVVLHCDGAQAEGFTPEVAEKLLLGTRREA